MSTSMTEYRRLASEAIATYERAATAHAAAAHLEAETQSSKPEQKMDAIRRIMARENPLTGKAHSATSAEQVAEMDEYYAQFLAAQRVMLRERMERAAETTAARLRVQLYLACLALSDLDEPALAEAEAAGLGDPLLAAERVEMAVVR